jgi:hypothetical protein
MPRSHLVYLAVGNNPALHAQAAYAMLSALAFKGEAPVEIHLFTDVARESTDVAGLSPLLKDQITLDSLPPARIASLVPGAYDPYRLKLAVLREIALRFPSDASIFCDADTFFLAPYASLLDRITGGARVLHRLEYNIGAHPTPQMKKFRRALHAAGLNNSAQAMWNSGVIGLPPHSAPLLDAALETLADLSPHTPKKYLAEQFSISRALSEQSPPQPAEDFLFHYWFQKADYTRAIQDRLAAWQQITLAEACARLRVNPLQLPAPPQKLHWWERALIAAHLRRRPEEIRGLPRQ